MARPKDFIKYIISEPEIAVGHWPFSDQFQDLAEQKWFARTNLLYISSGEVINIFLLLVNGWPISNPYFKLCHFAKNHVLYNNIFVSWRYTNNVEYMGSLIGGVPVYKRQRLQFKIQPLISSWILKRCYIKLEIFRVLSKKDSFELGPISLVLSIWKLYYKTERFFTQKYFSPDSSAYICPSSHGIKV